MNKHIRSLRLFLILLLLAGLPVSLQAQSINLGDKLMSKFIRDTTFQLTKNVRETHLFYLNAQEQPMAIYILEARLKKNKLIMEATSPFNRDTFARQTVREQMKWENGPQHKVLAGINADFFNMSNGTPSAMSIKEGDVLRDTIRSGRGFVGVMKNGKVFIGNAALYVKKEDHLREALGGYQILLKKGHIVPQSDNKFSLTRHPRTALGLINKRKVIFVVVDGRQPEYANGMPLDELALLMKSLGARSAINLDGGGSSTLVSANPGNSHWVVRNRPSDGQPRKVANAWIIVDER